MSDIKKDAACIHTATARLLVTNKELIKLVQKAYSEGFADSITWQNLRAQGVTSEEFSEEASPNLWEESISHSMLTDILS